MKNKIKISVKLSTFIIAIICCLIISSVTIYIFRITQDRARLLRDNFNEQIFNQLFTGLRDYETYGSIIEATPSLKESILGIAIYRENLTLLYRWGKVPDVFDESLLHHSHNARNNRFTISDQKNRSIQFILNIERRPTRITQMRQGNHRGMMREREEEVPRQNLFFDSLDAGNYFYINIYHPSYWRTINFTRILFPFCEILLLFFIFYIRKLYLRNIEYQKKIDDQKNLVVLGTAASTLAHEIKNPLLSIRLQTGILRKFFSEIGIEEINIVEEEVERISALVYRVNDYLRDAVGNPALINIKEILQETFLRLCGKKIFISEQDYFVFIDIDRARSIFENIISNAIEADSKKENIQCTLSKNGNDIIIEISDKGKGISKTNMAHIFDPFFTSKSTGTGIGLSISKRFIEAAKGKISFESKENEGTLVRIIFSNKE